MWKTSFIIYPSSDNGKIENDKSADIKTNPDRGSSQDHKSHCAFLAKLIYQLLLNSEAILITLIVLPRLHISMGSKVMVEKGVQMETIL